MFAPSNPFSTKFIRPGAIPFVFDSEFDADKLFCRFEANHFRAQILGPHGSGKSTLVREIEPLLNSIFDRISYAKIRTGADRIVVENYAANFQQSEIVGRRLLVVDGAERVSSLHRWFLKTTCRQQNIGLLATVHSPIGWLPTIASLRPELSIFWQLCDQLQLDNELKLDRNCLEKAFHYADGNFREAFMALYDDYEHESRLVGRQLV